MTVKKTVKKGTTSSSAKASANKKAKAVKKEKVSADKFAVIETGGKQYLVYPGMTLKVEKLPVAKEGVISFDKVLLMVEKDTVKVGAPYLSGVKVEAKSEGDGRSKKITVLRYKNKTRYHKKKGHRQHFTKITITKI